MLNLYGTEKAHIAALLTAVIVIVFGMLNIDVTEDLRSAIEMVATALAGAGIVWYGTWRVPNKSSEPNEPND